MERRTEVKTYCVTLICDTCKEGEMIAGNTALLTNPPSCPHQCNRCGHVEKFVEACYPLIRYESVQESEAE